MFAEEQFKINLVNTCVFIAVPQLANQNHPIQEHQLPLNLIDKSRHSFSTTAQAEECFTDIQTNAGKATHFHNIGADFQ